MEQGRDSTLSTRSAPRGASFPPWSVGAQQLGNHSCSQLFSFPESPVTSRNKIHRNLFAIQLALKLLCHR